MIAETSLEAFRGIIPELGDREFEVYTALKSLKVANNQQIHKHTGIPLSSVCGRMNKLRTQYKLVTFSHKGACPYTKKSTNFYTLIKFQGGK